MDDTKANGSYLELKQ